MLQLLCLCGGLLQSLGKPFAHELGRAERDGRLRVARAVGVLKGLAEEHETVVVHLPVPCLGCQLARGRLAGCCPHDQLGQLVFESHALERRCHGRDGRLGVLLLTCSGDVVQICERQDEIRDRVAELPPDLCVELVRGGADGR